MKVRSGNLNDIVKKYPETRGWIAGHFISFDQFFQTDDFEVKWSVHSKGEKKDGVVTKDSAKTFGILVKGKYTIRFPDHNKEIILSIAGDYIAYDTHDGFHTAEALEDTTLLTIRWPSKRNG